MRGGWHGAKTHHVRAAHDEIMPQQEAGRIPVCGKVHKQIRCTRNPNAVARVAPGAQNRGAQAVAMNGGTAHQPVQPWEGAFQ